MRERAQELGAVQVFPNTEVLGIDVENGRVTRVRTDRGDVETDVVVIACGVWSPRIARDGRCEHPAHACGAPDDRRRPGAALPLVEECDRVPDRARHGHEHVRAAGRAGPRGGVVRAPADPPRAGRHPVDRRGVADAHRAAVHAGGLRAAARAGARARAGDPRRRVGRHQVRDQRAAVADAGRAAAARRDARGQGTLVGRGRLGEGRARRRSRRRRVDDARRVGDRPPVVRHRALLRRAEDAGEREGARVGGLQQDVRDRSSRRSSGRRIAACASRRSTSARRSSARCSTRRRHGSGRTGTSRTPGSSTSTACRRASTSGMRAGGRRSSMRSILRCATAPRCST